MSSYKGMAMYSGTLQMGGFLLVIDAPCVIHTAKDEVELMESVSPKKWS